MSVNARRAQQAIDDVEIDSEDGTISMITTPKRGRVRNLARKTKAKTKTILNLNNATDSEPETDAEDGDVFADSAFNPAIVLDGPSPRKHQEAEAGAKEKLKAVGTAIAHPRRAVRDIATKSAADQMSKVQRPFLSGDQDHELLTAHDNLVQARSSASSIRTGENDTEGEDEFRARQKVEQVEENRESAKIAWAIGRHVQRVRIVQKMLHRPRKEQFMEPDPVNGKQKFRWDKWIAKLALYYTQDFTAQYIDDFETPPFDLEDMARIVERISMTSAPWQAWLIDVRRVYIWEDPKRTARWMMLYWFLWYFEYIMGFLYACIIYTTLRNRFYPDTVESVRQAYERSINQAAKAQAWGELVQNHGHQDWIEPMLDELGPIIQLQLADLAEYLEILANFYKWVWPRKTAASLFFFFVWLLISLLADMAFCMKIVWFIVGGSFFFTYPVATRFPQYRRLLSAWRWFLWDIPTDAEWSIRKLQEKTLVRQCDILSLHTEHETGRYRSGSDSLSDYTTPETSPTRVPARIARERFDFRVYQGTDSGHLVVNNKGLKFKLKGTSWRLPFIKLVEMRKTDATKKSKIRALKARLESLELVYLDSQGVQQCEVLHMAEDIRHEVFSLVLGMSGLRWRALQIERNNKAGDESKSHLDRLFKKNT